MKRNILYVIGAISLLYTMGLTAQTRDDEGYVLMSENDIISISKLLKKYAIKKNNNELQLNNYINKRRIKIN